MMVTSTAFIETKAGPNSAFQLAQFDTTLT